MINLKQFLKNRRTILQENQRILIIHQNGGNVTLTIDELYSQRNFEQIQAVKPNKLTQDRYTHFINRTFRNETQN